MKKIVLFLIILSLVKISPILADEVQEKKLTEELLGLMKVQQQQEKLFEQIRTMQTQQMQKFSAGHSEEEIARQQKTLEETMDYMVSEMSWEKLKDDYINAYTEVFTEEELQGLVDFYKGPVGQKFLEKNPELTSKMMKVSQKRMDQILPKLQAMAREAAMPSSNASAAAPAASDAKTPRVQ